MEGNLKHFNTTYKCGAIESWRDGIEPELYNSMNHSIN